MLNATTLDDSLAEIVSKLQTLMDSFWIYIVMAVSYTHLTLPTN